MFLNELATPVPPSEVIINAGSPGLYSGSGLGRNSASTFLPFPLAVYFALLSRKPKVSTHIILKAALNNGEDSRGRGYQV